MFDFDKSSNGDGNIIKEIMSKAADNAINNMKTLDVIINSKMSDGQEVGDLLNPSELFTAVSNYLEVTTSMNNDSYKDVKDKMQKIVMTNPVFQQLLKESNEGYYNIGLTLVALGTRLMELELTEEEVVKAKLDAGTLTKEDIKYLLKSNIRGLSDETVNGIDAMEAEGEAAATTSKVKVNDKNSVVELIKKGNISAPTMYILLQSKEVTTEELRDSLDGTDFAKVMAEVNDYARANGKDLIPYPAPKAVKTTTKNEKHCHDCSACKHKELCDELNSDANTMKQKVTKMMSDKAADESEISDDEKVLRRAIDKGLVSVNDIVLAVEEKRLNPFYLEVKMKKEDVNLYAEITVELLKRNAPHVLENLGDNPFEAIVERAKSEI